MSKQVSGCIKYAIQHTGHRYYSLLGLVAKIIHSSIGLISLQYSIKFTKHLFKKQKHLSILKRILG